MRQLQVRPKGADPFHRLHQPIMTLDSAPEDVRCLVAAFDADGGESRPLKLWG